MKYQGLYEIRMIFMDSASYNINRPRVVFANLAFSSHKGYKSRKTFIPLNSLKMAFYAQSINLHLLIGWQIEVEVEEFSCHKQVISDQG